MTVFGVQCVVKNWTCDVLIPHCSPVPGFYSGAGGRDWRTLSLHPGIICILERPSSVLETARTFTQRFQRRSEEHVTKKGWLSWRLIKLVYWQLKGKLKVSLVKVLC